MHLTCRECTKTQVGASSGVAGRTTTGGAGHCSCTGGVAVRSCAHHAEPVSFSRTTVNISVLAQPRSSVVLQEATAPGAGCLQLHL